MGMALAAIADDGDLLALDQVQVGVAIVVNTHGPILKAWAPKSRPTLRPVPRAGIGQFAVVLLSGLAGGDKGPRPAPRRGGQPRQPRDRPRGASASPVTSDPCPPVRGRSPPRRCARPRPGRAAASG